MDNQCDKNVIKPYQCEYCDTICSNKSDLKCHIRTHTDEKPYQCSEQSFSQNSHLESHMKTHTREKPYQCSGFEKKSQKTVILIVIKLLILERSHIKVVIV